MVVVEFVIFVVSSGLFCSGRFRHHLWAVIVAGVIATGSSLLFVYDFAERMLVHTEAPVKVVKQVVRVPVVQRVSQPPALSRPENCRDDYPFFARVLGQEGITEVGLSGVGGRHGERHQSRQVQRLGSARRRGERLCGQVALTAPALKDNQLVDAPMTVR